MIFDSKYYPKIMFLALIVVSLLIVFNFANIMQDAKTIEDSRLNQNNENNNQGYNLKSITGFAIEIDRANHSGENITNDTAPQKAEFYSARSYFLYYILLGGLIAGIFITFMVLRSTIMNNIEHEEAARKL